MTSPMIRNLVAEVFQFGTGGKVSKASAHYAEWQA